MSQFGNPDSATYAVSIDSIEGMLDVLPNNTSNQIQAQNVRDVVAGLWVAIQGLSQSIANQNTVLYNNSNPSSIAVGGLPVGSVFNGTVQQVFDRMFYPYVQPIISLTSNPSVLEFGNPNTVVLNWSIHAKSNDIFSAIVFRPVPLNVSPPTNNNSQIGNVTGTPTLNTTTTFTFSVNDLNTVNNTGGTYLTTAAVSWGLRRYWGTFPTFGSMSSSQVIGLTGAGSGLGSELATSRVQTRNGINGGGQYLVFAWPSTFGEPSIVVNGLINNAFTKVNTNLVVTNTFGYTASYSVYMSNTPQNSPISSFQIN
jgi:hypothetical protein